MNDVIILGASGHAAEIDEYIKYSQKKTGIAPYRVLGFLDDDAQAYAKYRFSAPFLGSIKEHKVRRDCLYIIGIANMDSRKAIVEKFVAGGADFATFIHCDTYLSESAKIGKGAVIAPNVNIGPNVTIGNFTLINSRSSMGHDTKVGKCNFISPNVCFSGHTIIGDNNLFGINSATIPGIVVGNGNKIAAGMILDRNVGDDSVIFYRHKEKILIVPKDSN